ncbi:branched-chain amino acid ABC transporter [Neisseria sp.]|uniref:branched-chain amino acid ABC transporter n=1 Tax=Neisseria sp. TaxID=192066 RepID=UPI0035A07979
MPDFSRPPLSEQIDEIINHLRRNQSVSCADAETEDLLLTRLDALKSKPATDDASAFVNRLHKQYFPHEHQD